jgi:toxin ParE1/3/4
VKERAVTFATAAEDDLDWIFEIIEDRSGRKRADDYTSRIVAACQRLSYASERGHRRDDIRVGLRIVGFERRVTIAFSVSEERVDILRILYGGANWESEL